MNKPAKASMGLSAAAYVRKSTEHQQYSTANQLEVIREFARQRGLELVKVFSDEGKSGLTIRGRAALSQLIGEVLAGTASFSHILVYDISRWGRFQDPDEAAHYEFLCRQAGLTVHYCAEQFENDDSLTSLIAKSFKRAMAGEYSRELSAKVFAGACHLVRQGYKQGGVAVLGLRRMLVDQNGRPKTILKSGEQKHLQTDRVVFVPGPEAEIKVVRCIFEAFVAEQLGATEIARRLNQKGMFSLSGRPWTDNKIHDTLRNENYIGNLVYARRSGKLGCKRVPNPPADWIRREQAFPGIIPSELFGQAQKLFEDDRQKYQYTETELLEKLRAVLTRHGYLTQRLINQSSEAPPAHTYHNRFGSLVAAYRLIGFQPPKAYRPLGRQLDQIRREMIGVILRKLESLGATATWDEGQRRLVLNQELRIWIILVRHDASPAGTSFWRVRRRMHTKADVTLVVRLDRQNEGIQDFYLLPALETIGHSFSLAQQNGAYRDTYRFQTLDVLLSLAARVKLSEAL